MLAKFIEGSRLRDLFETMYSIAREYIEKSYSPYSRFRVSSVVLCDDGRIFAGVNIENASYGLSICAERVAVYKAVSEGCKNILKILILSDSKIPTPPCGACRQVLAEFSKPDTEVIMVSSTGLVEKSTLGELLPKSFSREFMERSNA